MLDKHSVFHFCVSKLQHTHWFLSKLLTSLMRNYIPKSPSGTQRYTLSKLYYVPVGVTPHLRKCIALFAVAVRVANARYRMISDEVSLSQMLHDILGHDHVQWHPQLIRHYTNLRTYYQTDTLLPILTLLPNFGGFHRTLQRVRLANRGCLLLRTPGPVPFGTCICSNVETFWVLNIPRYFYFACLVLWQWKVRLIVQCHNESPIGLYKWTLEDKCKILCLLNPM